MRRGICLLIVLTFVGLFARTDAQRPPAGALAQVVRSSLTGAIVDQAGAPVSGVQITLTPENVANPVSRMAVSDAAGQFQFPDVPAGTYRVEASVPGFARVVRTGIAVTSGQTASLSLRLSRVPTGQRGAPPPKLPPPAPVVIPPPPPPVSTPIEMPSAGRATIPVFYATDRAKVSTSPLAYGASRNASSALELGRFDVHVPRDHQNGMVERPDIWTLYREDPDKHLVITSRKQQSYDEFYEDVRSVVGKSKRKDAFVFVHGFNVAFEDAVFRTAQISYDLGFDGAPILYSWPSVATLTPVGYVTDEGNNEWTVPHLRAFLEDVAQKSGATRIHLIAHSMGNRALVRALDGMTASARRFNQVMLTAPDIDASVFVQLADGVKRNADMATLYASSNDLALAASKKIHGEYPRAGETGANVVIVPGIDTVDVSAIDTNLVGHFYYGDNSSVISDMFLLMTQALRPSDRPRLQGTGTAPNLYWLFRR